MRRAGFAILFVLGVAVLGAGVPFAWLWIASQVQRSLDGLEFLPLAVMVFAMLGTYLVLTWLATALDLRVRARDHSPPPRRTAWTRSLSSERHVTPKGTPIETMFVTATVGVAIAFEVWLFLFAGSSLPSGTG